MSILRKGTTAPQFSLPSTPDQKVSLSDFRGKNVLLAFYPADWSPVCSDELALFNEILSILKNYDVELLGISVDNTWCHLAFQKTRKFRFVLLSDFEPKGETAKRYGAYREGDGFCERALFLIDNQGIIRWSFLSPVGINPGADGILDALETLPRKAAA